VSGGIRSVPGLPAPLRTINATDVEITTDGLAIRAGARTDWFIDPAGGIVVDDAPALVMRAEDPWMLRARASAEHASTFDAAVLVVHVDERTWAKLCLELSPGGDVMIVSVVTRGDSDDGNSVPIDGHEAWLRASRLGRAFAFHYSRDGETWHMVRYFTLGVGSETPVEVGFLAQSPTGDGCRAVFRDIGFTPKRLADLRLGT
jgi:regulation of enolase protein 1 (concanavalin A-like superfamily)